MEIKKTVLSILFLLAGTVVRAQIPPTGCQWTRELEITFRDEGKVPRERLVDFTHMVLDLQFQPKVATVIGKVTYQFTPLRYQVDSLLLDAVKLQIDSVFLNDRPIAYHNDGAHLLLRFSPPLTWDQTYALVIHFKAVNPEKGIYFIGWNSPILRDQIWTQGQATDHRYWFPLFDDPCEKMLTEVIVTFDSAYQVISNGSLRQVQVLSNGQKRWHYAMEKPHSPYLLMLAIGHYRPLQLTSPQSGIPLTLWYYPEHEDRKHWIYKYSDDIMDFLTEEIGVPYPWEHYSQVPVANFIYGAMENTSATIFGDFFCVDSIAFSDRNYVGVNAHELTHQWFGDLITERAFSHIWLHESFATYYAALYERRLYGEDVFRWTMRKNTLAAMEALQKDPLPITNSHAGTTRHYPQGARVLDMLRYVVGDENFRKAIRYYLNQYQFRSVTTEDLLDAFHDALGLSLHWFWNQWLYHNTIPHFSVSKRIVTVNNQPELELLIRQTQLQNELFPTVRMPVTIAVHFTDGSVERYSFWIEKETEFISIPLPSGKTVSFVLFDENDRIMKQITFPKSYDELIQQAQQATYAIDRYDAIQALNQTYPIDSLRALYHQWIKTEPVFYVQGAMIEKLAQDKESHSLLLDLLKNGNVEAQKKIVETIPTFPENWFPVLKALVLQPPSYALAQKILEKMSMQSPELAASWAKSIRYEGFPGKNVEIEAHRILAWVTKSKSSIAKLVSYMGPDYEFVTRRNAIRALRSINYLSETALVYLLDAYFSPNRRLGEEAKAALQFYLQQPAHAHLIRKAIAKPTFSKREQTYLQELDPSLVP